VNARRLEKRANLLGVKLTVGDEDAAQFVVHVKCREGV
jgi:hypothetical protein